MTASPLFNPLDLTTLPLDDQACVYENRCILAGHFNDAPHAAHDLNSDPTLLRFLAAPYPFKLQFSMMQLCLGGTMRVRVNLNEYELRRNTLLISPLGSIGQCLSISSDYRVVLAAFSRDCLVPEGDSGAALIVRKFMSRQPILQLTDAQATELLALYRALRDKLRQPDFRFKQTVLTGYLQVLYGHLCQLMAPHVEEQDAAQGSHRKQIFDRFIAELHAHYTTERTIRFYADRLCLTPKYLSQVVHAVSGRHAGDWIRDYVILEAKALLKSQRYSVQQVSDLLNFANQSFFGTYFKRAVGCSPTAYKEM